MHAAVFHENDTSDYFTAAACTVVSASLSEFDATLRGAKTGGCCRRLNVLDVLDVLDVDDDDDDLDGVEHDLYGGNYWEDDTLACRQCYEHFPVCTESITYTWEGPDGNRQVTSAGVSGIKSRQPARFLSVVVVRTRA